MLVGGNDVINKQLLAAKFIPYMIQHRVGHCSSSLQPIRIGTPVILPSLIKSRLFWVSVRRACTASASVPPIASSSVAMGPPKKSKKSVVVEVLKSPNDPKAYRYVQLASGMSALLISDPQILIEPEEGEVRGTA